MRIEWSIEKKRGNLRPKLTYEVTLDDYEKSLCLPMVRVQSDIPEPPESFVPHCWPDEHERGSWTPGVFYQLSTPSYKTGYLSETLTLPWRPDNQYPEVEHGFADLRDAFEDMLKDSSDSAPLSMSGELETTMAAKRQIASAFLAERILQGIKPEA